MTIFSLLSGWSILCFVIDRRWTWHFSVKCLYSIISVFNLKFNMAAKSHLVWQWQFSIIFCLLSMILSSNHNQTVVCGKIYFLWILKTTYLLQPGKIVQHTSISVNAQSFIYSVFRKIVALWKIFFSGVKKEMPFK